MEREVGKRETEREREGKVEMEETRINTNYIRIISSDTYPLPL